ncbi:unnamed protein product [Closterium sp. Naga37s-1]|nr:unnamed protein product [Closterium sp. Naga37s-1]
MPTALPVATLVVTQQESHHRQHLKPPKIIADLHDGIAVRDRDGVRRGLTGYAGREDGSRDGLSGEEGRESDWGGGKASAGERGVSGRRSADVKGKGEEIEVETPQPLSALQTLLSSNSKPRAAFETSQKVVLVSGSSRGGEVVVRNKGEEEEEENEGGDGEEEEVEEEEEEEDEGEEEESEEEEEEDDEEEVEESEEEEGSEGEEEDVERERGRRMTREVSEEDGGEEGTEESEGQEKEELLLGRFMLRALSSGQWREVSLSLNRPPSAHSQQPPLPLSHLPQAHPPLPLPPSHLPRSTSILRHSSPSFTPSIRLVSWANAAHRLSFRSALQTEAAALAAEGLDSEPTHAAPPKVRHVARQSVQVPAQLLEPKLLSGSQQDEPKLRQGEKGAHGVDRALMCVETKRGQVGGAAAETTQKPFKEEHLLNKGVVSDRNASKQGLGMNRNHGEAMQRADSSHGAMGAAAAVALGRRENAGGREKGSCEGAGVREEKVRDPLLRSIEKGREDETGELRGSPLGKVKKDRGEEKEEGKVEEEEEEEEEEEDGEERRAGAVGGREVGGEKREEDRGEKRKEGGKEREEVGGEKKEKVGGQKKEKVGGEITEEKGREREREREKRRARDGGGEEKGKHMRRKEKKRSKSRRFAEWSSDEWMGADEGEERGEEGRSGAGVFAKRGGDWEGKREHEREQEEGSESDSRVAARTERQLILATRQAEEQPGGLQGQGSGEEEEEVERDEEEAEHEEEKFAMRDEEDGKREEGDGFERELEGRVSVPGDGHGEGAAGMHWGMEEEDEEEERRKRLKKRKLDEGIWEERQERKGRREQEKREKREKRERREKEKRERERKRRERSSCARVEWGGWEWREHVKQIAQKEALKQRAEAYYKGDRGEGAREWEAEGTGLGAGASMRTPRMLSRANLSQASISRGPGSRTQREGSLAVLASAGNGGVGLLGGGGGAAAGEEAWEGMGAGNSMGSGALTLIGSARSSRALLRQLAVGSEGLEGVRFKQLKGRKKNLKLVRSRIHGWGLLSLERIEAGDFIIEYTGTIIRRSVSALGEWAKNRQVLLRRLEESEAGEESDTRVDATRSGGLARFINHSCDPNCYTKVIVADGQKHVVIYSKRVIQVGEELSYDYKFPIEDDAKIPCLCLSRKCRGYLN